MNAFLAGTPPTLASVGGACCGVATAGLALVGLAQALTGAWLVTRFAATPPASPAARPPVTVLKPLHGDEPLLEAALTSLCRQDYPVFQIVFGVQDAADSALATVARLRERFPDLDITLVVDPAQHGPNRKVGNLINMMAQARHDILVLADADIHVRPDYLDSLVAALRQPGVGLVTTLYAGLPCARTTCGHTPGPIALSTTLGASQITHFFLPGALLARALGRQDCLGATMCLRRHELEGIGGLVALVNHLADDNVLGRRIASLGLSIVLADTLTLTTVPEDSFAALFQHELRWARTIRALEPVGFAASALQYPLAWACLTILLTGASLGSIGFFLVVWVLRAVAGQIVDRALMPLWTRNRAAEQPSSHRDSAIAFLCPVWLLPLREVLSVAIMLASYGGRRVYWRGQGLNADTPPPSTPTSMIRRPRHFAQPGETKTR